MATRYSITVGSPLGERRGTLLLETLDGTVSGTLSLLNTENTVAGHREGDTVYLTHRLQTLLSPLACSTELRVLGDAIDGVVRTGGVTMPLHGTAER